MVRVVVSQSLPAVATNYLRELLGADFEALELGGRPQEELLAALTTADRTAKRFATRHGRPYERGSGSAQRAVAPASIFSSSPVT